MTLSNRDHLRPSHTRPDLLVSCLTSLIGVIASCRDQKEKRRRYSMD